MRVLMINSNRFKQPWPVIPFGMCCVAAAAENAGHEVRALDLCFSRNCSRDINEVIRDFRPEVVGVTIRNIDNSAGYNTLFLLENTKKEVIQPLKDSFDGPIVIGGPSVGISGAEMLEYLDIPFAVRGDGELAFNEFLSRLAGGEKLDGVGGLVRRENGQIVEDNTPLHVPDLNGLPHVNPGHYIDLKPYQRFNSPLQVQTKRGCPLTCTYCTYNRIEGRSFRLRDPKLVVDEIEKLVRDTGIKHIEFTDSTFNIPLDHCKSILKELSGRNLQLDLRTMGLNPGTVDDELVELMKQTGFRDVDLGAEAGCDAMLESLGKNYTKEDVLKAGRLLREKEIPTTWYLLVGAPGETRETLRETFDTINQAASPWDLVNIGVGVRVYNGAPLAEEMRVKNPDKIRDNFLHPVNYESHSLSLDEVKFLTKKEAIERPNYFMYDEDENTPPEIIVAGTTILKIFAPHLPLWKLHIFVRTLQKNLGIGAVKKYFFLKREKFSNTKKAD